MKKGRFSRIAQLGGMAVGVGADLARTAVADTFHRQAAKRLARVLGEMKGLPLKMGQLLSYIDDMIPPEQRETYREILGELQASTVTFPFEEMEAVVVEQLGAPTDELFDDFDREPLAAASIGQVYAATFEGRPVVVKVQYPGVAEALESDLANVGSLVSAMNAVLPGTDMTPFVEDVTARIAEELEYEREAAWQERFRGWWADDPDVVLPAVVRERSADRVLTSERIDAMTWDEMLRSTDRAQRSRYGLVIWRFVFGSLHHHQAFNADPHPGNYLFLPDGRVAFLDFGCVQSFDRDVTDGMAAVRRAIMAGIGSEQLRMLATRHMGIEGMHPSAWTIFEEYLRLTMEPVAGPQPFRFSRAYTESLMRDAMSAKQRMATIALRHGLPVLKTPGMVFMGRINVGLASILATLGTEADWRSEIERLGI
ncbi:MAG: AarF/ABC1/UbiB kinase family protein [Proteobacteria bacterium]|nr:AarF/ABC1/UbiB kinase family protein [Pseudomonadota bacterium]MCP4921345.1 AarF/ABC1/UbiB kinase family protein [Pseudomonadota bacterium]